MLVGSCVFTSVWRRAIHRTLCADNAVSFAGACPCAADKHVTSRNMRPLSGPLPQISYTTLPNHVVYSLLQTFVSSLGVNSRYESVCQCFCRPKFISREAHSDRSNVCMSSRILILSVVLNNSVKVNVIGKIILSEAGRVFDSY